jgi:hypothetical protein
MNTPLDILSLIFAILCFAILAIRNIYYFQFWSLRDRIECENLTSYIFPIGLKKIMFPILLDKKPDNEEIQNLVKKVNFYSYLFVSSFAIAFLSGFLSKILQ